MGVRTADRAPDFATPPTSFEDAAERENAIARRAPSPAEARDRVHVSRSVGSIPVDGRRLYLAMRQLQRIVGKL